MIWTGWSNGSATAAGSGYGLRVSLVDRDNHFDRGWKTVTVQLPDRKGYRDHEVLISGSFWRRCSELRSRDIGQWLLRHRLAPWPKGSPPKLIADRIAKRVFRVFL